VVHDEQETYCRRYDVSVQRCLGNRSSLDTYELDNNSRASATIRNI
jgi:hypothetical protein